MLFSLALKLRRFLNDGIPIEWDAGEYELVNQMVHTMLDFPQAPEGFKPEIRKTPLVHRVVLMSGGMDSAVMWRIIKGQEGVGNCTFNTLALFVDYGQPYAEKELASAKRIMGPEDLDRLVVRKIKWTKPGTEWGHIVPGRNFLLLTVAISLISNDGEVWLGAVDGESEPNKGDKSPAFLNMFEQLVSKSEGKYVSVKTLDSFTKNEWLKHALHGTPTDQWHRILDTVTCFSGTSSHRGCGECQACLRKWIALVYNGISPSNYFDKDPFIYAKQYIDGYIDKMTKCWEDHDFNHYSENRILQDLSVIASAQMRRSGRIDPRLERLPLLADHNFWRFSDSA